MSSIRDVAELAQVSTATVSHVINSTRYVSPELTERVRAAMLQLNYQPDAVARSLRRRETLTLGLLIPNVEIPFFASVASGIERVASENGYNIILCNSNWERDVELRHLQDLLARRVDGLICITAGMQAEDVMPLIAADTPIVMFEESLPGIDLDVVGVDNELGAYDAARHLLSLGHERIGVVTGRLDFSVSRDRLFGFRQAMQEAGLPVEPDLIFEGDYQPLSGRRAAEQFLALPDPPTAIEAFNDLMAMGAVQAMAERGLRAPQDFVITGFDDIPMSRYMNPALTTIRQPLDELCRAAIMLLLQRIRGLGPHEAQYVVLPPRLIVRSSTVITPDGSRSSPALEVAYARTGSD